MITVCPKCGYKRQSKDDHEVPDYQCPDCGVIYAKYTLSQHKPIVEEQISKFYQEPQPVQPVRPVKLKKENNASSDTGFIDIRVARMVADFFLGIAAVITIGAMLIAVVSLFTGGFFASLIAVGAMIGSAVPIAWFGYVIKLLLGIYINTMPKDD